MFSYLIVVLFAVLAVSSIPLIPCDLPTAISSVSPTVFDASFSGPFSGGVATYFWQQGNPGACGQVNPDSALVCAMNQARFGTEGPAAPLCGQQVQITNVNNGKMITVTIADDCPTCQNSNSIDLSVDAFNAIADAGLQEGEFPIIWSYVSSS